MIELLLENRRVALSEEFSLEMEYENPYFTKSSSFSLDVEVPVDYIPENMKTFGAINRMTAFKYPDSLKGVAIVNGRCVFSGKAIPLSINNKTASLQLLDGNSYFNYQADEVYIDQLNMSVFENRCPDYFNPYSGANSLKEEDYKCLFGSIDDCDVVFHPACNGNPDDFSRKYFLYPNDIKYGPNCIYFEWSYRFSTQPYLIKVLEKVMEAAGYYIIRNDLNDSWLRNLYICNRYKGRVSSPTPNIIRAEPKNALPHWTLNTFVDEIEKLCACIFVIDDFNGVHIIALDKFYQEGGNVVVIPDENVLDEYELDFEEAADEKDITSGNVEFEMEYSDKYLKVEPDVLAAISNKKNYESFSLLQEDFNSMTDAQKKNMRFIDDDTNREYIAYKADEKSSYTLKEINLFGMLSRDGSDSSDVSLKICPANTKVQNIGWWFGKGYSEPSAGLTVAIPFQDSEIKQESDPQTAQEIIENSVQAEKEETKDNIEVMISTGQSYHAADYQGHEYYYPLPFTDFRMNKSYKEEYPKMSLSLKDVCENSLGHLYRNIPSYHSNRKYIIRFLAAVLPDVKQIFLIRNQRYVCRKLTVTYTMNADSFVHEGEFYRIE